jgi:Fe-S cluster assembly iron-binding protein IscA
MLTLTEDAARLLAEVLDRVEESDRAVRIVQGRACWVMRLDREGPEDESFEHEGRTILLLDPSVAETLDDKTLDVDVTAEGWKLRLE